MIVDDAPLSDGGNGCFATVNVVFRGGGVMRIIGLGIETWCYFDQELNFTLLSTPFFSFPLFLGLGMQGRRVWRHFCELE